MKKYFLLFLALVKVFGAPLTPNTVPMAIAPANIADSPLKITSGTNLSAPGTIIATNYQGKINGQIPDYYRNLTNAIGTLQSASFPTGLGLTNSGGFYSNNINAGTNIIFEVGVNGIITIHSTATNGTSGGFKVDITNGYSVNQLNLGQPTLVDFTNEQHGHTNGPSGGQLDAAAIATGTINPLRLTGRTITGISPIGVVNGDGSTGNPTVSITKADASNDGYLSSIDWIGFALKQAPFVTGLGITNIANVLSNNIVAGTSVTIVAGANGQLTINSLPTGSGAPVGTVVNLTPSATGDLSQFSNTTGTNLIPLKVGIGLTNRGGTLSNNIVAGSGINIAADINGKLTVSDVPPVYANSTIVGNISGSPAIGSGLTPDQVKALLGISSENPFRSAVVAGATQLYSVGTSHTYGGTAGVLTNYTDGAGRLLSQFRYLDILGSKYGLTVNNWGINGSTMHYNYTDGTSKQQCHFNVLGFNLALSWTGVVTVDGGYNDSITTYVDNGWNVAWKLNKVATIARAFLDYYTGVGTTGKDSSGNIEASFSTSGSLVSDVTVGAMNPFPGAGVNRIATKLTGSQYYQLTATNWNSAAVFYDASDIGGLANIYTNGVQAGVIYGYVPSSVTGDKMTEAFMLRGLGTGNTVISITNSTGTNLVLSVGRIPAPATNRFVVLNTVPQTGTTNKVRVVMTSISNATRAAASEFLDYKVFVSEVGAAINPTIDVIGAADDEHFNPWGQNKWVVAYEMAHIQGPLNDWQQGREYFDLPIHIARGSVYIDGPGNQQLKGVYIQHGGTNEWNLVTEPDSDGGKFYIQGIENDGSSFINALILDRVTGNATWEGAGYWYDGVYGIGANPPANLLYMGLTVNSGQTYLDSVSNSVYWPMNLRGQTINITPNGNAGLLIDTNSNITFAGKHAIINAGTGDFQLRNNYLPVTGKLFDVTKNAWAISLGASEDTFDIYHANATAGTPSFSKLFTITNTGTIYGGTYYSGQNTLAPPASGMWTSSSISGSQGYFDAYNWGTATYLPVNFRGSSFDFRNAVSGAPIYGFGMFATEATSLAPVNTLYLGLHAVTGQTYLDSLSNAVYFPLNIRSSGATFNSSVAATLFTGSVHQTGIASVINGSWDGTALIIGTGLTNNAGVLSNNIVAGSNITLTGGANGQITIASSGGGSATLTYNNAASSPFSIPSGNYFLRVDVGAATINLPTAVGKAGQAIIVKNTNTSPAPTVVPIGGQTIDSNASYVMTAQSDSVYMYSDGANWLIGSLYNNFGIIGDGTGVANQIPYLTGARAITPSPSTLNSSGDLHIVGTLISDSTSLLKGNVTIDTGIPLSIKSGTDQRAGNTTLVGGTKTVNNSTVTANTIVMVSRKTAGGTLGTSFTYTVSAGVSFTITSGNPLDTSVVSYLLVEVP